MTHIDRKANNYHMANYYYEALGGSKTTGVRTAIYDSQAVIYQPLTADQKAVVMRSDGYFDPAASDYLAISDTMAEYCRQVKYIIQAVDYFETFTMFTAKLISTGEQLKVGVYKYNIRVTKNKQLIIDMPYDELQLTTYFNLMKHCRLMAIDAAFEQRGEYADVDYIWLNSYFQYLINREIKYDETVDQSCLEDSVFATTGYTIEVDRRAYYYDSTHDSSCMYDIDELFDSYIANNIKYKA